MTDKEILEGALKLVEKKQKARCSRRTTCVCCLFDSESECRAEVTTEILQILINEEEKKGNMDD